MSLPLRSSCRFVLITSSGWVTIVVTKNEPHAAASLMCKQAMAVGTACHAGICGTVLSHLSPKDTADMELSVSMALAESMLAIALEYAVELSVSA